MPTPQVHSGAQVLTQPELPNRCCLNRLARSEEENGAGYDLLSSGV